MIIFGIHAVAALLESQYQIKTLHLMVTRERDERLEALRDRARAKKITVSTYDDKRDFQGAFNRAGGKADELNSAQGAFAQINEFDYADFEELIAKVADKPNALFVFLDSVTDPQNLGSILRSCAFFGVDALITMDRRAAPITAVALKISSGGFCHVPVAQVGNLVQALERVKEENFWVYGLSEHAKTDIKKLRTDGKIALVIGNEEKGLRNLVERSCDELTKLPVVGTLHSLNAAVATAVALALVRNRS